MILAADSWFIKSRLFLKHYELNKINAFLFQLDTAITSQLSVRDLILSGIPEDIEHYLY